MIQKAANTCPTPGSVTVFPLYSPDLVLQPGIEPVSPALQGGSLTTGHLGSPTTKTF